jgi:hypothetical protein
MTHPSSQGLLLARGADPSTEFQNTIESERLASAGSVVSARNWRITMAATKMAAAKRIKQNRRIQLWNEGALLKGDARDVFFAQHMDETGASPDFKAELAALQADPCRLFQPDTL